MPAPTVDSIREALEQRILLGEHERGARLDETQLATHFGVSRTPIREALRLLHATGLVEHRPNRGMFVRSPEPLELLEMFEVMAELEALCGARACRAATSAQLATLGEVLDACEAALGSEDPDVYFRENERLHFAIFDASANRFLAEQAGHLHRRLRPFRRLQLRVPGRMSQSMDEHRRVVQAIRARDSDAAAEALRHHIAIQGTRFNDLLVLLRTERTG